MQALQARSEFSVKLLKENLVESRVFFARVKAIVEIERNICRLALSDSNGDIVYCLLLGSWAEKGKIVKKGYEVAVGPSRVMKVPDEFKGFYAPFCRKNTSCYYFHYEVEGLGFEVVWDLAELKEAEILGYTGLLVNVMAAVMDVWVEGYERSMVYMLTILDYSINSPVYLRLISPRLEVAIGDVILLSSIVFVIENSTPCAVTTEDTSVEVLTSLNPQHVLYDQFQKTIENSMKHFNQLVCSLESTIQIYLCVLKVCLNFPEPNKCLFVLYDYSSYYMLVNTCFINAKWLRITQFKISQNYLLTDELSCVCGYPENISPVKEILSLHKQRLEIVKNEAIRKTSFFDRIFL